MRWVTEEAARRTRCAIDYPQSAEDSGLLDGARGEPGHDAALEDQDQQNQRDRDRNSPGGLGAVIGRELGRKVGDFYHRRQFECSELLVPLLVHYCDPPRSSPY